MLADDGRVFCWGSNEHGQLGSRTTDTCALPNFHGLPPKEVPCRETAVAVDSLTDVAQIAIGASTACARSNDGTVRCWGENTFGTVGDGTTTDRHAPVQVPGLAHVAQIALSSTHACACHDDGTVDCWGLNFAGQLGTAPEPPPPGAVETMGIAAVKVLSPRRVPGLSDVVAIGVGTEITCAKDKAGDVRCFGKVAPRARGHSEPTLVPELRGATALVLNEGYPGTTHCALFADGSGRCWGVQAGAGPLLAASTLEPSPVVSTVIAGAARLALSPTRACAVGVAGEVSCWGDDGRGGNAPPARVTLATASSAIALGANHACALGHDGSVSCWGDSFYGQAGAPAKGTNAPTSTFWTAANTIALP
ncbi:MAG: hypothetical protein IT373_36340 [Polyangiaceae bacterium]|nr:hypothetical protein [Polyangiaceae bacterium]